MKYDIEVAWQINNFCDFNCPYCWLHNKDWKKINKYIGYGNHEKIIKGFQKTGLTWLVHMSGGEPFYFPHFVELCQRLTDKHFISINTNLNHKDIITFAEQIDPKRVDFLHCSLHPIERREKRQIEDFIRKFDYLKSKGFKVFASYLTYPPMIKRFRKYYAFFKSHGIILRPKVFWGKYLGVFNFINSKIYKEFNHLRPLGDYLSKRMIYPGAYSRAERDLLLNFVEQSHRDEKKIYGTAGDDAIRTIELSMDKNWLTRIPSYQGQHCLAGYKFVRMDQYGNVNRCIDEPHFFLGNLFEGEIELFKEGRPCSAAQCSCPYVGIRYVGAN